MKVGSKIFNFFWIILVGIWSAISSVSLGIVYCISVIGIPLGLQHFKFVRLVFAPAGKRVILRYGKHPIINTLWLLLGGGLVTYCIYWLLGILCCLTVVGIPLGRQLFKYSIFSHILEEFLLFYP